MSHVLEQMLEGLALEVKGLKEAMEKLTDRISEAAGLWESHGYATQPYLFQVKEGSPKERVAISCPGDVWLLCKEMKRIPQEQVDLLLLNTRNHVIRRETVFLGSLNASVVHPREIFASAIKCRAASVIMVHNHPSGDMEPSAQDIEVTQVLKRVGELVQIPLVDHIIIGDGFSSLKEMGHL